ncbi:MAG: hypothetical protein AAF752_13980 [Bacteroidota bacterium]
MAVILAQIYARYQRGQTQDLRFEPFGQLIPVVIRLAETSSG